MSFGSFIGGFAEGFMSMERIKKNAKDEKQKVGSEGTARKTISMMGVEDENRGYADGGLVFVARSCLKDGTHASLGDFGWQRANFKKVK